LKKKRVGSKGGERRGNPRKKRDGRLKFSPDIDLGKPRT